MIEELQTLSSSEQDLMLKAPLLVCILIAGADNEIDRKEMRKAIELAEKKKENVKTHLADFYHEVAEDFEDKMKFVLQGLPRKTSERNSLASSELSKLNAVLLKLDRLFARDFYLSLRYIAERIAESSGGILSVKSVGEEERNLIRLPMIKEPFAA